MKYVEEGKEWSFQKTCARVAVHGEGSEERRLLSNYKGDCVCARTDWKRKTQEHCSCVVLSHKLLADQKKKHCTEAEKKARRSNKCQLNCA